MTINWTRGGDANGTSLIGEITISYDRLVRLFGKPDKGSGDGKTDAEWTLTINNQVVTIYNWKDGRSILRR
jgi:hypothetical protein